MKAILPQKFLKAISCFLFLLISVFGYSQTEIRLPDGDVSVGTWTATPLWSKINGIGGAVINTPNINDSQNTTGVVSIQNPTNAGTYTSISVRFVARKNGNGGATRGLSANISINGIPQLEQIAAPTLENTFTSYVLSWTNLNFTQEEMNSLQIAFTSTGATGSQGNLRIVEIDFIEATLTYCPTPAAPTSVTATNATICQGSSSNLNATSAGNTIRWYTVLSGGTPLGTSASGVNFPVSPTATTTYYAEALAGGACVSATRTPVTVTVNSTSAAGTVSANQSICSGSQPATISLTGSTGSIQWQSSTDNVTFTNISGATSSTLTGATIGTLSQTTFFRAVVTSGVCPSVNSATVTVTVNSPSVAGTVSANQVICSGSQPATISLTGSTGAIQWQSSTDNLTFTNISGATSSTLTGATIGTLSQTTYFRAVVTSGVCPSITSATVTVTVNSTSVAGTVSANQSICSVSQPSTISLTGSSGSIQWQSSSDNITFTTISGATGSNLTGAIVGALSQTTYFRAVVTSGVCSPVTSATVTVTLSPLQLGMVLPGQMGFPLKL